MPMTPSEFRRHGHALVDWIAGYMERVADLPVRPDVAPGEIRARLPEAAPEAPEPFEDVLRDLDDVIFPGLFHWQSPHFFGYFPANTSPAAVLGELAAAGLGQQGMLWSTSPACTEVESAMMDWLVDLLGLPQGWKTATGPGGGVLQMSASDSTHTALVVARHRAGAPAEAQVAYTSTQAHSSIEKGARVAGYGHVRAVAVDEAFALRPDALEAAIAADRAAGLHPTFLASSVGTTGTTAVDPVRRCGEIARAEGLWHHVDAAYAGTAMLCPEFRRHQDGLELADSYTFNPHKWMAVNFDCSAFWVADRAALIDTLSITPPYLRNAASDAGAVIDYRDWHVPLGRRFRALKLWFVLRTEGAENLRARVRKHVRLARELAAKVDADSRFERVAPTTFALVSFRCTAGDDATRSLGEAINAQGPAFLTPSVVDDRPFLRVSIGHPTTEQRHVDALWTRLDALAGRG